MTKGYRPQESRPTPPVSTAADTDVFTELRDQITALHSFVKDRASEQVTTPLFWQSIGYALGHGEACIEHRDVVGAVRRLEWFRTEAERWEDHPNYPARKALNALGKCPTCGPIPLEQHPQRPVLRCSNCKEFATLQVGS
ncbi:hypothetical protein [Streptomyces tirandamycinicus]|uniref:Uncharacterized protein n=1 Tax=Streptomyces tirandamycinicus TaxID=2174846 RepID=A0A2S1T2H4_9ACTN|nr:hypothetical protein [Streptomyces tirandamycinicus]AWI32717.1 hypothetical protein DDW44_30865 [Streptomyces tirandamycinicus]